MGNKESTSCRGASHQYSCIYKCSSRTKRTSNIPSVQSSQSLAQFSSATMHILDKPHTGYSDFRFPFQCLALKLLGVWPIDPAVLEPTASTVRLVLAALYCTWSYVVLACIGLTCAAQAWYVFHSWGDILVVTECGCTVLMGVHNLLRLLHLNGHRGRLLLLNRTFVGRIWISR